MLAGFAIRQTLHRAAAVNQIECFGESVLCALVRCAEFANIKPDKFCGETETIEGSLQRFP